MKRQKKIRTLAAILFVLVLTIALYSFGILGTLERMVFFFTGGFSKQVYQLHVTIDDMREEFQSPDDLLLAYRELKQQYVQDRIDAATLEQLTRENDALKAQLKVIEELSLSAITAPVIGKSLNPGEQTLLIGIQKKEDVHIGDPVIADQGALIGVVVHVREKRATIRLLSDTLQKIGATLTNRDQSIGVVEGGFGKSLRMNVIPQHESVDVGDIVVTSGIEESIPYGLPIGIIEAIEKEPYQPFQSAVVSPLVEFERVQFVSIISF